MPDRQPPVRRRPPDPDARRPRSGCASAWADLAGKKIAVSWAYSPSYAKPLSVPQGLVTLLTRFGAHVTLAQPEGYRLMDEPMAAAAANAAASGGSFRAVASMDEAFAGRPRRLPEVVGPVGPDAGAGRGEPGGRQGRRWPTSRSARSSATPATATGSATSGAWASREDALYLHCLPADIGAEVSPGVMERFRVDVAREANKKVYVIMALLAAAKVTDLAARLDGLGRSRPRCPLSTRRSPPSPRATGRSPPASCARPSASPPTTWTGRSRRAATRSAASATTRGRGWST